MKLQTGLMPKSLWFMSALFCVPAGAAELDWSLQPPGPGGSPNEYRLEDIEISLQRTKCFGLCPIYQVRIDGDGTVIYEGEDHVRVEGRQEGSIDKATVLTLMERIYHTRFFEMKDGYYGQRNFFELNGTIFVSGESMTQDLPQQIVTVRIGDYEKRVVSYVGSLAELIELIEMIDTSSGARQWVDCDGPRGACL